MSWVEAREPQSGKTFYANLETGQCSWEKPEDEAIKERDEEGEWWELFDEKTGVPYYFNPHTSSTVWEKPATGHVIRLSTIKDTEIGKRLTLHLEQDPKSAPPEVAEASGTVDIQHTKLLPGWKQVLDPEAGKNYYINEETQERTWDRSVATGMVKRVSVQIERLSPSKKSDSLKKAKKLGISGPVLNKEAATAMNSLNPLNHEQPKIPGALALEITKFGFEDFSKKYFATHKKGVIFKRKVPLEEQMKWSKDPIPAPLMALNKERSKEAVNCFKTLQRVMGDKGTLKESTGSTFQNLVEIGITEGMLRDELYVQLCKQLNQNPSEESTMVGWQLMSVYVNIFPPSKNFEQYLFSYLKSYPKENPKIETVASYCESKLKRICRIGAKGKVPTIAEIERAADAAFNPSIFGESLEDVMKLQTESDGDIPKILPFLTEGIVKMNGEKAEGIFRVPGDGEMVTELRLRLEKGNYDLEGVTDPMVPASLLKLWLRELADPLIPVELYPEAIKEVENPKVSIALIHKLDPLPARVISYIIKFLQKIADPAHQPFTKMTVNNLSMVFAPNFLRCPSDNPQTIFENAKLEQNFVRNLILHLNVDGPAIAESSI